MEARNGGSKQNQPSTPAVSATMAAHPPSTRRPRVREVSSRFMSPVSSSSSSSSAGDLHFLTSNSPKPYHHQQHHQIQRSVSARRYRRQLKLTAEGDENRSSEMAARSLDSPFTLSQAGKLPKQFQSKPLKENSNRLDTPTPVVPPPARSRLSQQRLLIPSAASRHLQFDMLPTLSCRTQPKIVNGSVPSSPLNRSLNSPLSGRESNPFSRIGLSTLPPVPPNSKIPAETKKQKKASEQLEDVHSLKLLHNRHLQWRFANANAKVKTESQRSQTENMLYSFGLKISELSDSVQRKRIELERLLRVKTLLAITESQTPSLDQWSAIEEEYSNSMTQTIEALSNASLRLPLDADVKTESKQLGEALVVASKVMDGINQNTGKFMSKAKEMESLVSELAKVTSREKSLAEDCGNALLKTQASHIEECSLRSQLIQQAPKGESSSK